MYTFLLSDGTVKVRGKAKIQMQWSWTKCLWKPFVRKRMGEYMYSTSTRGVYRYESYITDDKFFATLLLKLQTWMNNFNALFAINHNNHSKKRLRLWTGGITVLPF